MDYVPMDWPIKPSAVILSYLSMTNKYKYKTEKKMKQKE